MKSYHLILAVEDDPLDLIALQRAFRDAGVVNPLTAFSSGVEALAYLNEPSYEKPAIILLDINLPGMNGLEFLRILKSHEQLRSIPVVILSTSNYDSDIQQAYALSAASYIVKPIEYSAFVSIIKIFVAYWAINEQPL